MTADHGDNPNRHGSGGDPGGPSRFDIVLRGYDRRQVEDHIAGLERTIARQRGELELARGGSAGGDALGDRPASSMLSGPAPMGGQHRDGSGLTPEMIGSFTSRLQSILQAAEEEAEEVRSNARAFAQAEEQAGRARLEELERRRKSVLSELSRVRTQLDGLLGQTEVGSAAGSGPAPSAAPSPAPAAPPATERTLLNPAPVPGESGESARSAGSLGTPAYPLPKRAGTPSSPAAPRPAESGKPRPTPSPRPRSGSPNANLPGKDLSAGPAEQGSRNGSGTRGDDDGRSAFGSGGR